MIRINLATRKRAANAMPKGLGESLRFDGGQLKAIWVQFLEFPLKKIGVTLACGAIATFVLNGYKDELVKVEQAELIKVLAEKPKLEAESGKLKGLQETQKSMESDEKRIRTKLETIKKLGVERAGTVLVLEEISKITPPSVWFSDFALKGNELSLKGASADFGNISDFTKMIEHSAMFTSMTLKDTQIANDQGRQVASFNVTARKR